MLELARALKESGHVDVVDVNDNPRARARMSGLMASATIERVVGIETIPHLTPRDSSIAGLESMLLGAHAEGIRNVLAVTGDPPEAGDYPGARGVYEVDSIGLSQMITRMNAGEDFNGREIDAPTSFFLGVAVNPAADDLDYELERFEQKLEAGARFAMTQVLFDFSYLDTFVERLGGSCPIPLLVGIFYVRSYQLALRLHNEVPGIVVPEHVQARLRDAGPNAGDVGPRAREGAAGGVARARRRRLPHPALPAAARRARPLRLADLGLTATQSVTRSRPPARASVRARLASEDAVAAASRRPASEHGRSHAPLRIDAGPAGDPRLDVAPDRRHRPRHRPAPYASRLTIVPVASEARRDAGQRPVPRIADERDRHAPLRIGERERPARRPATRRTAMSFATSNATTVDVYAPAVARSTRGRGCRRRRARS